MRSSSEPGERAQFSVAELLARCGEPTSTSGRRRRRAPDDDDTAVESILERVRTDTGPLPVQKSRGRHGPPESGFNGLVGGGWPGTDRGSGTHGPSSHDSSTQDTTTLAGLPALVAERQPATSTDLSDDPATEQFPRLDPVSLDRAPLDPVPLDPVPLDPVPLTPAPFRGRFPGGGEPPAGLANGTHARLTNGTHAGLANGTHAGLANGTHAGLANGTRVGLTNGTRVVADQMLNGVRAGEGAGEAPDSTKHSTGEQLDGAETPPQGHGSPVREWAVMATQVGAGVVGGAALWLICEWLWQRIPVLALVVALAVITGLVWVVRRVRRADDLQTTVIAVLVGLFVTVSPAALLLVGR